MGDIAQPGNESMRLEVEAIGSAPVERIDIFHGPELVRTALAEGPGGGSRIRTLWRGAEYRGRGREVIWRCAITLENGRFSRAKAVNFLNPEHKLQVLEQGRRLACHSVTTGNAAAIDLWLEDEEATEIVIETHLGGGRYKASSIDRSGRTLEFGGLGRQVSLYRLPDALPRRLAVTHTASRAERPRQGGAGRHPAFSASPPVWRPPANLGRPDSYFADVLARAGDGWHHSAWTRCEPVAASADKVHLDVAFTRYRADNTELGSFGPLWVISLLGGRWAAQLRSSFAA
jgi:hypothetical protein